MEYINLGKSGLKVSRICLGMMTYGSSKWRDWVLDEEDAEPIIKRAIELGINFFDTADMYSQGVSEMITWKMIKKYLTRDEVVIASKVFHPTADGPNQRGLSRKHIMSAIDATLKRLGTDYVDLYQIHRWDYDTPIEETLDALNNVVKTGKARYIGASSMHAWQFAKALYTADKLGLPRFISMQNHYNLIYREEEREMIPFCREEGVGVIPWSPLARGFLTGTRKLVGKGETKRSRSDTLAHNFYYSESDFAVLNQVENLARKLEVSAAQIALAWLLQQKGITCPIVGASRVQHLEEAVGALKLTLNEKDITTLQEPYQPHPLLGHK